MYIFLYIFLSFCQGSEESYIDLIEQTSINHGLDPDLAVAIAYTESSLNPNAIGDLGEIGLFQLRPEFHNVEKGNVSHNVNVAVKYLVKIKEICENKYGKAWFICFNTGPYKKIKVEPTEFSYYKKVMRIYGKR